MWAAMKIKWRPNELFQRNGDGQLYTHQRLTTSYWSAVRRTKPPYLEIEAKKPNIF